MKQAVIITIGDEILIGQVIDTNSVFLASELNKAGISVHSIISIHDNRLELIRILDLMIPVADIIILTGGLGPTSDDITKPTLAEYFKSDMALHKEALEYVRIFLDKRGVALNDLNLKQAMIPSGCSIIPNHSGTAMGMWFRENNKHIIAVPGVPFEMKAMVSDYIIPRLIAEYQLPSILHKTIITSGIAESVMAGMIAAWENNLPEYIKLAYLPSPGILRLRLSAASIDYKLAEDQVNRQIEILKTILGNIIVGFDEDTIESVTGRLLKDIGYTISVAESCTGGNISKIITSVPGASEYFKGGITAYSNQIKQEILKVDREILHKYGAVSEEVVKQMAENCRLILKSDFAIAVSGVAGPTGGTPEKPVGTVWIAVSSGDKTLAQKFNFGDNRDRNIQRASLAALNMMRLSLLERYSFNSFHA